MTRKSAQKELKKYSGVADNVKETQTAKPKQKEIAPEPTMTPEQIIQAFNSFGFEPNERNNDIGYWSQQPLSDSKKLMDELYKRRSELNSKEDTDKASKATLPRLSDEEINALFDEYGLPPQDPEFVRSTLPNDPQKIRSILEMQRKMGDDLLKKESTNAVNAVPETPKAMPQAQAQAQAPMPMQGQGAPMPPSPMGMQGEMMGGVPTTPFFVGDHALIRIVDQNNPNSGTLWLVDKKRKVLRPMMSENALENAFEDPEAAKQSIMTLSSQALSPSGPLAGFTPMTQEKGIRDDGSMKNIEFSPAQLKNNYGKPVDLAKRSKAVQLLDGILGTIKNQK